jgi:hypothetical protein
MVLPMLGDGRLHLSGIALLAPHLTPENREALLRRATHRSKRQIEELIAEVAPREDVPALTRRLPERRASLAATPSSTATGPAPSAAPTPSGMDRTVAPSLRGDEDRDATAATPPVLDERDSTPPLPAALSSGAKDAESLPPVLVRSLLPGLSVVQPLAPGR